jgi:plastocyanin
MRRWGTIALAATVVLILGAFGLRSQLKAPVVHAAQTWGVAVGGEPGPGLTSINFYPRTLSIAAGDTVSFTFPAQEPHTVTFDAGQVPGLFFTGVIPDNPNKGDFNLTTAFSPVNWSGSSATYDGSKPLSTGVPSDAPPDRMPYNITFPKAGVYHYECAVHGPLMSADITVLPSGATLPETPAQAKARGDGEAAADATNTHVADEAFAFIPTDTTDANGVTHHTLSAGTMGFHISEVTYTPPSMSVKQGDYVTWTNPDTNQFHTVTFLSGAPQPPFLQIIPQSSGQPLEIIPALVNAPSGGDSYTGTGYVNSGTMTPGNSYTLKIDAPPGTYQYVCLFHGDDYDMKGTITVTP